MSTLTKIDRLPQGIKIIFSNLVTVDLPVIVSLEEGPA